MRNYYEILGVPKSSDESEIRKAYKKLAIKLHPDRGGDEEKFKELATAYEVLSDKNKRNIYDQFGEEGLKEGFGGMPGGPGMDPFNMFFGMGNGMGHSFFGGKHNQKKKCEQIVVEVEVTLEQLYNGAKITKNCRINKICKDCKGSGAQDDHKPITCNICHGSGIKIMTRQIGPGMIQQMQSSCDKCHGEGKIIDNKYICKLCQGKKVTKCDKQFDITINSHMHHGMKILQRGRGQEYPNHESGDIIFVIVEKQHLQFKHVDKHTLLMKKKINLVEALTGFRMIIEHLDKRKLYIDVNEIIKPGSVKKIINEGIPQDKGDLIIEFDIEFPTIVDQTNREKLEDIFNQKVEIQDIINGYQEKNLYDYQSHKHKHQHSHAHYNNNNTNNDHNNEGPPQCTTQ